MKTYVTGIIATIIMTGCNSAKDDKIDITPLAECPVCEVCPDPTLPPAETVNAYLSDEEMEKIDLNRVKLNHYINDVKVEENWADIIDNNGSIATKNHFELGQYDGEEIRHVLIVEFFQIN